MSDRRRPPTIKDVAAEAHVSPSTVSHAFSGRRAISAETRQRVMEAARLLGYHANPHARSMRTGETGMIGLILRPRLTRNGLLETHETFNRLAGAIAVASIREGMGLLHIPVPEESLSTMLPMDGCIVAYPNAHDPVIDELMRRGVPLICTDPDPARPDICPWVGVDYDAGINQILETLAVDPGDEVWLMVGSEDNAWKCSSERIMDEWARSKNLNLRIHRATGEVQPSDARGKIDELLRRNRPPRALVYGRSDLTEPVVSAIGASGLRVPQDIQLAALTDSAHARIPLRSVTALDLNHEALAQATVSQMLQILQGASAHPEPIKVSPLLKVRTSTQIIAPSRR